MHQPLVLGIDFGTSTNFVTKYDFVNKTAVAVANMGNYGFSNVFDNCLYIENENNTIIGASTLQRGISDPDNFFSDFKRHISDDNWQRLVPNLNNMTLSAADLAERMFDIIKKKVEKNEARAIDGAVITVPYSYGDSYKKRLTQAAQNAGIPVLQMIEEPVAAAVSFGMLADTTAPNKKEKVVVFDLGGGTFDITVFEFEKNTQQAVSIEVINTDGVERLGGNSIDAIIASYLLQQLQIETDEKPNTLYTSLLAVAKKTKEELSEYQHANVDELLYHGTTPVYLETIFTRDTLEKLIEKNNIINKINEALQRAIYGIELSAEDIDRIILAGGSSTIPIIKKTLADFFNKEPESTFSLVELVGNGAGILAGLLYDKNLQLSIIRKTSKNIGIRTSKHRFKSILHKNQYLNTRSAIYHLKFTNPEQVNRVTFYEGESMSIEDCEIIGVAPVNAAVYQGEIGIALQRCLNSGRVKYHFFDRYKKEIDSGFLLEK